MSQDSPYRTPGDPGPTIAERRAALLGELSMLRSLNAYGRTREEVEDMGRRQLVIMQKLADLKEDE